MLHVESMIYTDDEFAVFIKEEPSLTYVRYEDFLVGTDEDQTIFDLLHEPTESLRFGSVERGAITFKNGEVIPPRSYYTLRYLDGIEYFNERGIGPLYVLPVWKLAQTNGEPEIIHDFLYIKKDKHKQLIDEYAGPLYSSNNFKIQLSKNSSFIDELILLGYYSVESEPNKVKCPEIEIGEDYVISIDAIKPGGLEKPHVYMIDSVFTVIGDRGDGYYYLRSPQDDYYDQESMVNPYPAIKGEYLIKFDPDWEDELPF